MFEATIPAVYEGGVFRPTEPVNLNEGDRVQLSVVKPVSLDDLPMAQIDRIMTPEHRAALQKMKVARTSAELFEAFDAAVRFDPPLPDGYDFEKALEANRGKEYRSVISSTSKEV